MTLAGGGALGATLWRIDGPPHLLGRAPDWSRIREVLAGSELADADVIAAAATVAWLALGYLALTIGLRFAVTLAVRSTDGASWARTALRLSNLVTIPAVRRAVDGGVAGTLMLASWLPASSRVAIAAEPAAVVAVSPPFATAAEAAGPAPERQMPLQQQAPRFVEYTVVRGDYLWDIARRLYGDGSRFVEIFEANRDRVMTAGERFTDPRLIRPGWVLRIPMPAQNLDVTGAVTTYRVRDGDHLWGIAERFLGDGFRWVEIWERNQGRELSAGRRLTDPVLIFPGWLLELPIAISETAPTAPTPRPAEPAAPSVPAAPTATVTPVASATPHETRTEEQAPKEGTERGGRWSWEWPSTPRRVLVTAAGFAVIGGSAVFVQRLIRNGRLGSSSSGISGEGPGDAGRVTLATRALARALADYGFGESQPLFVRESRRRIEFTVRCPVGDAEALIAHRHDLGRRLACEIEAEVIGATRVTLTLSGFQRLAGLLGEEADGSTPALVVPVGADEGGIVYLNIAAVGSVAVAGSESERRQLLRSWLATLATTHAPQELALRVDTAVDQLLGEYAAIPHTGGAPAPNSARMAVELEELVRSRSSGAGNRTVLAVTTAAAAREGSFDGVLRDGPRSGVFLIAAMPAEDAVVRDESFGASVVFPTAGEATEDERGNAEYGAIALMVDRDRPVFLDPVIVRRDTSTRWSAGTEGVIPNPFEGSPDHIESSNADPTDTIPAHAAEPAAADELPVEACTDGAEPDVGDLPQMNDEPGAGGDEPDTDQGGSGASEPMILGDAADVAPERAVSLPTAPTAGSASTIASPLPVVTRQATLFTLAGPGTEAARPEAVFSVRCLGHFEIRARGTPIEQWPLEKAREMLAFLVAQGGAATAREVVADALWPGYAWDTSLKHTLSNTASSLRGILRSAMAEGDLQPLIAIRQRFQPSPALFDIDMDSIEASFRRAASLPDAEALGEYERALSLYSGDFLEGELFTWLDPYRLDYRQRLIGAARRAAEIAVRLGETGRAAAFYQAIFEHEPTDEDAVRGLMRSFAASGDVNGARKAFKALSEALQRELDDPRAGPSAETRAVLSELITVSENP